MDLHCSFFPPKISILLLIAEFQTASGSAAPFCSSYCSSSSISPNELAPCCLTLWTPPACLHLWMTDVLFYILLKLSLTHTPTNVTACAAQVRSLPFTCSLFISFPSFSCCFHALTDNGYMHVFTYHLHYNLDKVYWIPKPIWPCFCANASVEITTQWEQREALHFSLRSCCQFSSENHNEGLW